MGEMENQVAPASYSVTENGKRVRPGWRLQAILDQTVQPIIWWQAVMRSCVDQEEAPIQGCGLDGTVQFESQIVQVGLEERI